MSYSVAWKGHALIKSAQVRDAERYDLEWELGYRIHKPHPRLEYLVHLEIEADGDFVMALKDFVRDWNEQRRSPPPEPKKPIAEPIALLPQPVLDGEFIEEDET